MEGFYEETSKFELQLRDRYANTVESRLKSEIQIIETSSQSSLSGDFTVSNGDEILTIFSNASPMEIVQIALKSFSDLGNPIVTSNSAESLINGKTLAVTKGNDIALPSDYLTEVGVGDWIRIGNQSNGPIFTIIAMGRVAPTQLSSHQRILVQQCRPLQFFSTGRLICALDTSTLSNSTPSWAICQLSQSMVPIYVVLM